MRLIKKFQRSREFDQSLIQQNHDLIAKSKSEEKLDIQVQSSSVTPSPATMARLKAAVTKDVDRKMDLILLKKDRRPSVQNLGSAH